MTACGRCPSTANCCLFTDEVRQVSELELNYFHVAPGSPEQDACIPMLAVCFDEFVQLQKVCGNRMPFTEESFIACTPEGRIAGHVGIMPMQAYAGNGKVIRLAGIASVGVHPDFRRRGIAVQLCENAAAWAAENQYDVLPLYTGLNHVYESCGWQNYTVKSVTLENPFFKEKGGCPGTELTDENKAFITACYENAAVFPGKIIREKDTLFHSWQRTFRSSEFTWHIGENGYALEWENTVAEVCGTGDFAKLCRNIKQAFLSPADPAVQALKAAGWREIAVDNNQPEFWHGENAMIRKVAGKEFPEDIFFSLADKF